MGPSDRRLRAELEALERSAPSDLPRLLGASAAAGGARRPARWLPTAVTLIAGAALGIAASQLVLNWAAIGERPATGPSPSVPFVGRLPGARVPPTCPITKQPDPPFVPPAAFPNTPPGAPGGAFWYGTNDLWTVANADGSWGGLRNANGGFENKSFWWSVAFKVDKEPQPALQITGRRLDAPGEGARVGPATNAAAGDIGSAMLTGVTLPTSGCWELTGRYREHELSFVIWIPDPDATSAATPQSSSEVATASVTEIALPIADSQTSVGDLAYDQSHDAIWFVGGDGGARFVFRIDTTSGHIDKWPLPAGGYAGVYVQVKTDAAGVVWIADDYQIVRFDPATHHATAHHFSTGVPGALPGALTGSSPGTWVSAIAPTNGGALVARHNVPWLTRLDDSLREVGKTPLPQGDEGAQDLAVIGQTIFVERDEHNGVTPGVDILDLRGQRLAPVPGQGGRLEVVGERVLRHGRDPYSNVDVEWVEQDGSTELVGSGSAAFADPRGGVTLFRRLPGYDDALQRVVKGQVLSQIAYKGELVQLNRCGGSFAPSGSSLPPSCGEAFILFQLSDLITDRNGVTWYVTTNTRVVYRAQL
jgi:hypothetical protein